MGVVAHLFLVEVLMDVLPDADVVEDGLGALLALEVAVSWRDVRLVVVEAV